MWACLGTNAAGFGFPLQSFTRPNESFNRYLYMAKKKLGFAFSLVIQGKHRLYSLSVQSDVLARTCFVTTRDEDAESGFQRVLDERRADLIADYIDKGLGTIPSAVVLSAQPEAELKVLANRTSLEFNDTPRAFLVLDGQHRIWGFKKAKTQLRVPVIIYNDLSKQQETRIFIDINTKQRPVPNELLLDIKKLADYETSDEKLLGEIFDSFHRDKKSPLYGLTSPTKRSKGTISRVTFNNSVKPVMTLFSEKSSDSIYSALSAYMAAFVTSAKQHKHKVDITNPTTFKASLWLFQDVAQRVKDLFGAQYTRQNFEAVLLPVFERVKSSKFKNPGNSATALYADLQAAMRGTFTL